MVYLITGKSNAGKTTLAYKMAIENGGIVIDADEVRKIFPSDFSDNGREEHIVRMAKMAALLEAQQIVYIAAIMPKKEWRDLARSYFKDSVLIYLKGGVLWEGTEYEEPQKQELERKSNHD